MKKHLYFIPVLVLSLFLTTPVFAQNYAAPTPRGDDLRQRFMTKLGTIKDEKKKNIVTRIDQMIAQINTTRTTIMLRHLDQISAVLDKIQTRVTEVAASGKDVSAVTAAITKARTAIAASRTAVQAQAAKTYTINITTEANLGQAVSAIRLQFAKDIQATNKTVIAARRSVRDVLVALAKVVGEKLEDTTNK